MYSQKKKKKKSSNFLPPTDLQIVVSFFSCFLSLCLFSKGVSKAQLPIQSCHFSPSHQKNMILVIQSELMIVKTPSHLYNFVVPLLSRDKCVLVILLNIAFSFAFLCCVLKHRIYMLSWQMDSSENETQFAPVFTSL